MGEKAHRIYSTMKNLIIILNYKNYKLTEECVVGLRDNGLLDDIIVVDNNSNNGSYEYLSSNLFAIGNVYVCKTEYNGGYSYGNNYAIRYMHSKGRKYEYYTIINPDIVINDKNYFNILEKSFDENENVAVLTGKQILNGLQFDCFKSNWKLPNTKESIIDNSFINYLRKPVFAKLEKTNSILLTDVVSGCCFTIRAELFEKVGMLDENVFLYYEENILAEKIKKAGFCEGICIETEFLHNHITTKRQTLKTLLNNKIVTIRSKKYYICKYKEINRSTLLCSNLYNGIDIIFTTFIFLVKRFVDIIKK